MDGDMAIKGAVVKSSTGYSLPPITEDIWCIRCGRSLRGLSENMACPDCGTAVGRSVLGDHLQFSDPAWVLALSKGANGIVLSVVIGALIVLISNGLNSLEPRLMSSYGAGVALSFFHAVPALFWLMGVWLIASPEPDSTKSFGYTLRGLLRCVAVLSMLVSVANIGSKLTGQEPHRYIVYTQISVGVVGLIALFVLVRHLALRIPNVKLADQIRIAKWVVISSIIAAIGLNLIWSSTHITEPIKLALAVPACMIIILVLVFGVWSLMLLLRFSLTAQYSASCAERTWAM